MRTPLAAALVAALTTVVWSAEQPPSPPPATEEQVRELEQKVLILERKAELAAEEAAEKAKKTTEVQAGKDGFSIRSADGAFLLRVRGYLQVDGAFFFGDTLKPATDTFFLRRARPIFEGTMGRIFDFKLMPDFGQGKTVLYDAYVDARFHPLAKLRAGKFKPPVGLERLQSATDTLFIVRAAPTLLVPNRDVGLQLHGDFRDGLLAYAVMASNGVPDGANLDGDTNDGKEVAARVFAHPFKTSGPEALRGLGLGLAASWGQNTGVTATPSLPSFKTPGDQTFFQFLSDGTAAGTAIADGSHERLAPQAYWYGGRVSLLAEYVTSSQEVRLGAVHETVENTAWQVAVGVLLTGDQSSYKSVSPKRPFQLGGPGKGALEMAARWSTLTVDDAAFPVFADPAKSARRLDEWAVALNWYLTRNVRISLDYHESRFDGGASAGADRETEQVVLSRFQVSF